MKTNKKERVERRPEDQREHTEADRHEKVLREDRSTSADQRRDRVIESPRRTIDDDIVPPGRR